MFSRTTIACSVLVSLLVSFSLDPMLSAYWPDPHKEEHEKAWITRKLDTFNNWFNRQAGNYRKVVAWALDHRFAMFLLAVGSMVAAMAMPFLGLVGGEFLPEDDRAELNIQLETPPGSNLQYTRLKAQEVARIALAKKGEVAYTYTTIGGRSGAVDEGAVLVRLVPKSSRARHQEDISTEMLSSELSSSPKNSEPTMPVAGSAMAIANDATARPTIASRWSSAQATTFR